MATQKNAMQRLRERLEKKPMSKIAKVQVAKILKHFDKFGKKLKNSSI